MSVIMRQLEVDERPPILPDRIECWFLACLLALGPTVHMRDAQEFFRVHIPNGSGCAWYAAWYMEWLYDKEQEVRDEALPTS